MRMRNWLWAGFAGLLIGGCAGPQTGPTPETKAAVAPTGKLRVGFISASIYVTKDPATGQLKGVAIDLGSELARRVGAEFQPVVFATAPAVIAGAKAGEVDVALMGINAERAMAL